MELVYNLNFKALKEDRFYELCRETLWPVKTIHKISILKGKLKVKVMERSYSCICSRWRAQIGCLWKLMRKLLVRQAIQKQCQQVKWVVAFGEMIYTVWKQRKSSWFRSWVECGTSVFQPLGSPSCFQRQPLHMKNTVQTGLLVMCVLGMILDNNIGMGCFSEKAYVL